MAQKRMGPCISYTTKELSTKTWPDFERLFSRGNGWDFCWCMHFHRSRLWPDQAKLRRAERSVRNRRDKRELVEKRRTHGILVYAEGEPVGWCQYGRSEELPRIDHNANYRDLACILGHRKLWRITCFVVDKRFRRRGIASAALKAALQAIKKKGGGLVEAYPLRPWDEVRHSEIRRRGHAPSFGNSSTHGTVPMFAREGFKLVAPFGHVNVVMRKMV